MQIAIEVLGVWILASLLLGPFVAWAFLFPERRARMLQEAHDHWIATHPTSPPGMMPEWLRWEETAGSDLERRQADELCRVNMRSR
jgi:hypothetical protein